MGKILQPVILSGGAGTRLWPVSRELHPKQLMKLTGNRTLIQETALRVADSARFAAPLIICNGEHRFLITDQLQEVGLVAKDLLIEPTARNTAAAVAVAALAAQPDDILLIMPADHAIADLGALAVAIERASTLAEAGHIVTFGITPDRPEVGYGYIKRGAAQGAGFMVAEFVEKPDFSTAQKYLESGQYDWNSGMFIAKASVLRGEFKAHAPAVLNAAEAALKGAARDLGFTRLEAVSFTQAPSLPFDKAVMEKTKHAAVVPVAMGWSDIGTWHSLWQALPKDERGNAFVGDVEALDCEGCLVRSDGKLTAIVGAKDMVVVVTQDAVLVAPRERTAELGKLVEQLKRKGRSEAKLHDVVHRPWGNYATLTLGERFQVKRITVKPGGRLSLQKHMHRAEHWTVVEGTAQVTVGNKVTLLAENESVYVPLGEVHRLENLGKIPLILIEVQSGSYLGEDDIIRLEDVYARSTDKLTN
jgi:mannose-1-phosphate guanylyltransferase / mannose-6-phosphate isomerase